MTLSSVLYVCVYYSDLSCGGSQSTRSAGWKTMFAGDQCTPSAQTLSSAGNAHPSPLTCDHQTGRTRPVRLNIMLCHSALATSPSSGFPARSGGWTRGKYVGTHDASNGTEKGSEDGETVAVKKGVSGDV